MAHATNGRDSNPKYLGVKIYHGQEVKAGNIILKQRGTKYFAGKNTFLSKDFSIHSKIDGVVSFRYCAKGKQRVDVLPK
jgi:large subunit ribosomal protein L27